MNDFRSYIRHAHPVMQLFLLIAVTLFSAGLMSGLGLLVTETLYQAGWEKIKMYLENPALAGAAPALKILQLFNTLGMFLLPAMLFSQIYSPQPVVFLRLTRDVKGATLIAAVLLFICFTPVTDALSWLNDSIPLPHALADFETSMRAATESMQGLMGTFLQMDSLGDFLFNLFLMAALPALGEEFFFRGILQRILRTSTGRLHLSVWVTAFAFALMHQQFFAVLPLAILGALLGYLKEWSGNLWVPILAHFVNNATIVVVMYFTDYNMSDAADLTSPELIYLVPGVLLSGGLIYFLHKNKVAVKAPGDDLLPEITKED